MKKLLCTLLLLLWSSGAFATVYYVDNTVADTNIASATPDFTEYNPITFETTGGSASVFKTIADINAFAALAAGDSVLFRKGQSWEEQLTVPSSGGAGNPITFSSFGSGNSPKIYNSNYWGNWWEASNLMDGGFEVYTDGSPHDTFNSSYTAAAKGAGSNGSVQASATQVHSGAVSAKLEQSSGSWTNYLYLAELLPSEFINRTEDYYFEFFGWKETDTDSALWAIIYVRYSTDNTYDILGTDLTTWTNIGTSLTESPTITWDSAATSQWVTKSGTFVGPPDRTKTISSMGIRFYNTSASGVVYLDDVRIWMNRTTKPANVIYAAPKSALYSAGVLNSDQSDRLVTAGWTSTFPITLWDAGGALDDGKCGGVNNSAPRGYMLCRNDTIPISAGYVGTRPEGIYINAKDYITIDGFSFYGPGGSTASVASHGVYINGASSNIRVLNSDVQYTSIGYTIGDPDDAVDVEYNTLTATKNASTGIYHNARGSVAALQNNSNGVFNCLSYNNANESWASGDGGGIGIQGWNLVVKNNTVYNNGKINDSADFEISVVQSSSATKGPVWILNNNISLAKQGGIQIAEGGGGSVISNNIISGANTSTAYSGGAPSVGLWSGIRLGGGATIANSGTVIANNTVVNGGDYRPDCYGIAVVNTGPVNFTIKNNLLYENLAGNVYVATGVTTTGAIIDNNLYYNSGTPNWYWKGTTDTAFSDWKTTSSMDASSIEADPLFISASNFKLQPDSPAVKAGEFVPKVHDQPGCKDAAGLDCNSMAIPIGAYSTPTAQPTYHGPRH